MVCFLQVYFKDQHVYAQLQQELPELSFYGPLVTGSVEKLYGKRHHFFETFYESCYGIKLRGSLHKFAHGNNADTFTFLEIKTAVKDLMIQYHIPPDTPLQQIEFGVNLPFSCPEVVIDSAMLYNGRRGTRYIGKDYYAIEWTFSSMRIDSKGKSRNRVYYVVKLYKKDDQLLRYELHIEDIRKIAKSTGIKLISDLLDDSKLLLALQFLFDSISMLFFVPDDYKKKLPSSLRDIWGAYRADSFWGEYEDRHNKNKKSYLKKHITRAIHKYDLIDWQAVMRDHFIKEGALIAGVSENQLFATFSHLGSQCETVADPAGESDRSTESKETTSVSYENKQALETIHILVNQLVANERLTMDDYILQVIEFFPLLPRGPPCLLFTKIRFFSDIYMTMN